MPRKICFLDRDGTLNIDKNYLCDPKQVELVTGIKPVLHTIKDLGYEFILVTNQSGIARGYFGFHEFYETNQRIFDLLELDFLRVYFCPHHPESKIANLRFDCLCRKPKPGMILQALHDFSLNPKNCILIGDGTRDVIAAHLAGVFSFLLTDEQNCKSIIPDSCRKISQPKEILSFLQAT